MDPVYFATNLEGKSVKKARLRNRQNTDGSGDITNEISPAINKEITKAKPVKFTDKGITVFQRKTRPTEEGLESEEQKPVLFNGRGRHINSESELKGECHICHKFVSLIFYCSVQGCKKLLCEEHVFIFKDGDSELHFCKKHYDEFIMNYDTWHIQKGNHEQHLRKNK